MLFSLFVCTWLTVSVQRSYAARIKNQVFGVLNFTGAMINTTLAPYMELSGIWKDILCKNNGNIKDFENISTLMRSHYPLVQSIQLAPKGFVTYIFPEHGNEKGKIDLFADPNRKLEAEYARDTRKTTLTGPVKLYQGGYGLIFRNPIYIPDPEGKEYFWGFSIVIVKTPDVFGQFNFSWFTENGMDFQVWRTTPDTGKRETIYSSKTSQMTKAVSNTFEIANNHWTISVEPTSGAWISYPLLVSQIILSLIISVLIPVVVCRLYTGKYPYSRTFASSAADIVGLNSADVFSDEGQ